MPDRIRRLVEQWRAARRMAEQDEEPAARPDLPMAAGALGELPGSERISGERPGSEQPGGEQPGGEQLAGQPAFAQFVEFEPAQPKSVPEPAPAEHPVPQPVRDAAEWSWRLLIIAAAVGGLGWLAWELKVVIFPVVIALLLSAGLGRLVRRLRLAGWGRGLSATVVFIGFLLVVVGSLTLVGNAVGDQFGDVVDQAEEGLQEVRDWLAGPPFSIDQAQLDRWIDRAVDLVQNDDAVTEGAATAATVAVEIIVGLILALFALLFFLYDGDRIWAWAMTLLPMRARARTNGAGEVAWRTLTQYVRGIVLVALFDAVTITILLLILRVPLAFPLGVLIFFGAFVPLIGAFITGAVALLVALVTQGLLSAIIVLAGMAALQQIESNIFQPLILGRMVRIHPLAIVVAVSIGTLAGGIIGAIVAVPIVAVANTVFKYLSRTAAVPAAASGGPPATPPASG